MRREEDTAGVTGMGAVTVVEEEEDEEEGEEGFPPLLMALTIELVAAKEARMAGEVVIEVPPEVVA